MVQILVNPNDIRYIFFRADPMEVKAILKHFNRIPQYQLLPTFNGTPMPEQYIESFKGKDGQPIYYLMSGLWRNLQTFCTQANIPTTGWNRCISHSEDPITKDEFQSVVSKYIKPFDLRQYQIDAAWLTIKYKQSLSELCTRSGKTAIMACILRYLMEYRGVKKPLIIVPSIHLVKQGVADFQEYMDFFRMGQVWAGADVCGSENAIIGTFQSLVLRIDPASKRYDPDFFNGVDCVVVDEVHKAACKSIKKILAADFMKNVKYKFGMTGTLPKPETLESYAVQSLMGPKIQEISSRELIEEGFLADPIIKQFRINYAPGSYDAVTVKCAEYLLSNYIKDKKGNRALRPIADREFTMVHDKQLPTALKSSRGLLEDNEYRQYLLTMINKSSKTLNLEQMVAMFSANRIELMDRLVTNLNKNVIIFAHNTEYIKYLEEHFTTKFPDRKVYKIIGATNLKKRQATIDKMTESNNCILIGSFGVIGTGLTFSNVDYGIFAQSFKADTITRQSLGRLMLRTQEKSEFYLYDIIDEFPTKKLHNQGLEKVKIYKAEGHRHEIVKINETFHCIDLRGK